MFYRLPFLFSITFYAVLLLVQIVLFGLVFSEQHLDSYHIFLIALNNLTAFFFIFILSNLFFYKNKIYFYIPKNKLRIIIFAMSFAIGYLVLDYLLLQLCTSLFSPLLTNIYTEYNNHSHLNSYSVISSWIKIVANVGLFICISIIFYCLVKWSKNFLQTPLIDGITRSNQVKSMSFGNQLNSSMNDQERCKFYAIIFSSVFCCVINGLVWNCYFNFILLVDEMKIMFRDYELTIFTFSFISLVFNYIFLYYIGRKFIKPRYLLPLSSLLIASIVIVILFIVLFITITFFIMPFFLTLNSVVMSIIWFIISYVLLYFLAQFVLTRYFA